jgi:hypothetical protein
MLIYQHLTEVTNECSDTEPVMFILQENRLYLELETIGPLVHIQIFGTFLTLSLKLMRGTSLPSAVCPYT